MYPGLVQGDPQTCAQKETTAHLRAVLVDMHMYTQEVLELMVNSKAELLTGLYDEVLFVSHLSSGI